MSAYVGSGYLLSVARRGGAPIAAPRRQISPLLLAPEPAATVAAANPLVVESGSYGPSPALPKTSITSPESEVSIGSPRPPAPGVLPGPSAETTDHTAKTVGAPPLEISAPLSKHQSGGASEPVTEPKESGGTRIESHKPPDASESIVIYPVIQTEYQSPAEPASENRRPVETRVNELSQLKMPEKLFGEHSQPPALIQPQAVPGRRDDTAIGPADEPASKNRGALEYRVNEVFKMPENFFGERAQPSAMIQSQAEPSRRDDTEIGPPALTPQANTDSLSRMVPPESAGLQRTVASASTSTTTKDPGSVILVRDAGNPGFPGRVLQPPQPPQPAERGLQQPTVALTESAKQEATSSEAPSAEVASVTPKPRQEQVPFLTLRPPIMSEAASSPQPRLRINRLDIQIINQPLAPQPPRTSAPDITRLLERRYLGRTDLMV